MVVCVKGEKEKQLFCGHLVRECDKWDIQQLYNMIKTFLHTENCKVFGERIEKFFASKPKDGEDIFSYMSRLDKQEEEIMHLEFLAQEAGQSVKMPTFYKVWKVLSAVEKYQDYRIFTEKIQQQQPSEWIQLSTEDIRAELHKIHANKVQLHTSSSTSTKHEQPYVYQAQAVPPQVGLQAQVKKVPPPPPPPKRTPPPPPPQALVGGRGGGRGSHGKRPGTPNFRKRSDTPAKYTVTDKLKISTVPQECV